MENTLYNDFIPSQEEIKKEYKGISKNPDKIEDLIYDGQIIEYFGLFFDDLYEIFKSEHYSPKSLNDANNYLMQNYYELDKDSEIAGVYTKKVDGKEKAFITKIGKNDFYKAYYMPIWENLSLKERAQVAKWHFDHKKDVLQSKNIKLRFIEHEDYLAYNQSFGMCMSNDYMYINNSLLFDSNPFELITTIEHEFQHINQENSSEYIIREKKDKHNLYEKIILGGTSVQNYPTPFSITKKEKDGLYLGYIMEQKAERRSLKEYKKINKANQQLFGVCEEQEQDTNKYIWNLKFRNGMLTVKQLEKSGKYTEKEIADYVTCKKIIQKSDYFSKLYLLWKLNFQKICILGREEKRIIESGKEKEKEARLLEIETEKAKREKLLKKLNDNYIKVLKNNGKRLPKTIFEELGLEEN